MRNSKGVTLVELLVYTVLLILVLGGVYAGYSLARGYYGAAQIETEAQQAAIDASVGVSQELAHATYASISLSETPPAILFLSARTDGGPYLHDQTTAELLFQRWVCIFLDAESQKLLRVERVLQTPVSEIPETAPTVQELLADGSLGRFVLGRNITEFSRGITAANTVSFQVRSSFIPTRVASGLSAPADAATQIILSTEVPIRQ